MSETAILLLGGKDMKIGGLMALLAINWREDSGEEEPGKHM